MKKINGRGPEMARALANREDVSSYGSLKGERTTSGFFSTGCLRGADLDRAERDQGHVDYVVWSYATPIAWHRTDGTWHKVNQKFSMTTSHHQGRLYLLTDEPVRV